jgi:hypothetical protein
MGLTSITRREIMLLKPFNLILRTLCLLALLIPAIALADVWMGNLKIQDPLVWPQGRSGNYGTVKYFIDENTNEQLKIGVTVEVYSDGAHANAIQVEAFTNLNRRDFAKVFESLQDANQATSYWVSQPMSLIGQNGNNLVYRTDFTVNKAGAYRVTTRFRINQGDWHWHNQFHGQRDAAVVVSPRKVLDLTIYEANPLVVEATIGNNEASRSTFEDFTDHDQDGYDPFNLTLVRNGMGFNTLWLMPAMPVTTQRFNPNSQQWVANHSPGSPYATRNYYGISGRLSEQGSEQAAESEFLHLVQRADNLGLNIFLDVAFNHSGRDIRFGQGGVDLGFTANPSAFIRQARPAWSTSQSNYREHASNTNDIATYAPVDRLGEHQWHDAGFDWFFGNYSSLGPKPYIGDTSWGGAQDERDLFYTDLDPAGGHDFEVENVWNYFAYILPYWLNRTNNGIDGIRADFAQGLPPRAWEYIINKTRQIKWDFIFLAEVLDPDQVLYRANRHFDLITSVDHYLYRNNDVKMSDLVASFEKESGLFGYNAAIMHNGTSHDEQGNSNAWSMIARYAIAAASYGVPMVYMSQPLGIAHKVDFQYSWQNIQVYWDRANPHVLTMYQRINRTRAENPALRSTNRWFLHKKSGGYNDDLFSVARWSGNDVILVFINLRDHVTDAEVFSIPDALPLSGHYQAVNLLADDPDSHIWPQSHSADDLRNNGIYVHFHFPNEVQYILLRPI